MPMPTELWAHLATLLRAGGQDAVSAAKNQMDAIGGSTNKTYANPSASNRLDKVVSDIVSEAQSKAQTPKDVIGNELPKAVSLLDAYVGALKETKKQSEKGGSVAPSAKAVEPLVDAAAQKVASSARGNLELALMVAQLAAVRAAVGLPPTLTSQNEAQPGSRGRG